MNIYNKLIKFLQKYKFFIIVIILITAGWYKYYYYDLKEFAKALQDYQVIVAVILAFLGWMASYYFNLRAQRQNFLIQLHNTARLDIVTSLKEYQIYLQKLENHLSYFHFSDPLTTEIVEILNTLNEYSNKWEVTEIWLQSIEEYKPLVNELDLVYPILLRRNFKFGLTINRIKEFTYPGVKLTTDNMATINFALVLIKEQSDLVRDLIIYLQVNFFSKIKGEKVYQTIYDNNKPRPMFTFRNGKLEYINDAYSFIKN